MQVGIPGCAGLLCRGLILLIIASFSSGLPVATGWNTAQAGFLDKFKPGKRPHEKIKGTFIASIKAGPWVPPKQLARSGQSSQKGGDTGKFPSGLATIRVASDGPATAPDLTRYLQKLADRIVKFSPVTGTPIQIVVTGDRDFGVAMAMPDGAIGFPLGMLRDLENEDEVAFWLAHEIAHVQLRHHGSDWFGNFQDRALAMGEMAIGYVNAYNSIAAKYAPGAEQNEISGKLEDGLAYGYTAHSMTEKVLLPGWNRNEEDEADLLAVDLIIRAGYNGEAAFSAMEKMQVWAESSAEDQQNREARTKQFERDLNNSDGAPDFAAALANAKAAAGSIFGKISKKFSRKHRSPEERLEALFIYYDREYADLSPPDFKISAFSKAKATPSNALAMRHYISGWEALDAWNAGNGDKAVKLARAAIANPHQSDAGPRYIFYTIRAGQKQQGNARKNLEYAAEGRNATLRVFQQLVHIYVSTGELKKALDTAETAWEQLDQPAMLYPTLIALYVKDNQMTRAKRLVNQCKLNHRKKQGKACAKALEEV